jgi:hypothetical protein
MIDLERSTLSDRVLLKEKLPRICGDLVVCEEVLATKPPRKVWRHRLVERWYLKVLDSELI